MSKAQVGDLIRIVKADDERYLNGDIFEVTDVESGTGGVFVNTPSDVDVFVFHEEYVIHRKAGEEDSDEDFIATIHAGETVLTAEQADELADYLTQDVVNHPNHYTQGKFETIEVIEEITSGYADGYVAYCVGNALKYEARAPFKHDTPLEDLRKAAKYLAFAIDYLDAKSTQ